MAIQLLPKRADLSQSFDDSEVVNMQAKFTVIMQNFDSWQSRGRDRTLPEPVPEGMFAWCLPLRDKPLGRLSFLRACARMKALFRTGLELSPRHESRRQTLLSSIFEAGDSGGFRGGRL